jgi:hypothetical protein
MTTPDDRKIQAGAPAEYSVPKDPMLTMMQDLEEMAAKLLKTARKLPPGPVRHASLK